MPTRRQQRLNELLLQEIALLVPGQMDDPRLTGVRITRVETTQDLSTAKVYFTVVDEDEAPQEAIAALQHAAGRLRTELGPVGLRRLPRLVFAQDKAFESGERVLWLLDHLEADEGGAGAGASRETDADAADRGEADAVDRGEAPGPRSPDEPDRSADTRR